MTTGDHGGDGMGGYLNDTANGNLASRGFYRTNSTMKNRDIEFNAKELVWAVEAVADHASVMIRVSPESRPSGLPGDTPDRKTSPPLMFRGECAFLHKPR
jgi:hypothetical protein